MKTVFDVELGKLFQQTRKEHGMSQQYVSERLNVSRSAVANWEQGRNTINADIFFRLCDVYNVDPNEIVKHVRKYLYMK